MVFEGVLGCTGNRTLLDQNGIANGVIRSIPVDFDSDILAITSVAVGNPFQMVSGRQRELEKVKQEKMLPVLRGCEQSTSEATLCSTRSAAVA